MSSPADDRDFPEAWLKKPGAAAKDPAAMNAEIHTLMVATQRGDREAFDALVGRLRSRAFRIAHSLVGSREDALDMAQETFMKVFRARDSFRESEPFLPWFHRILRNTCISHLRKRGRLRQLSVSGMREDDEPDFELIDPDATPPDARLLADERAAALHEGLTKLSAKDREILALRHDEELSYREIAEALGIPQGTVMSRLFHARRRLRERLAGALGDPDPKSPEGART